MGQFGHVIWPTLTCYFLIFRALQDGFFRFFFEKCQNDMSYFKVPQLKRPDTDNLRYRSADPWADGIRVHRISEIL